MGKNVTDFCIQYMEANKQITLIVTMKYFSCPHNL